MSLTFTDILFDRQSLSLTFVSSPSERENTLDGFFFITNDNDTGSEDCFVEDKQQQ